MFPQSILKRFPSSLHDPSAVFLLVNHRLIFKCYQISSKLRRELLYYTRDTCTFLLSRVVDISRSERRRNETFQTFRHTKEAFFPRLKETMILYRHAMCSATNSHERRVWFTRTINLKETRLNASPDGTVTRARMCTLDRLISSLLLEETSPWVLEKENECVSDDRDDKGAFRTALILRELCFRRVLKTLRF